MGTKIQRLPPLPPPGTLYHRIRKRIHLLFFLIFVGAAVLRYRAF